MAETVGFIGLGMMGDPMARNIRRHGHPMVVFDVVDAALLPLVAAGARAAGSPREVEASSDVVITMLPDAPDVEQAALGPDGIIEGLGPDAVYVDMSTIDPATTRRIGEAFAARGLRAMDCPVGRTQDHAVAGTLILLAGGEPALIEQGAPGADVHGRDPVRLRRAGLWPSDEAHQQRPCGRDPGRHQRGAGHRHQVRPFARADA